MKILAIWFILIALMFGVSCGESARHGDIINGTKEEKKDEKQAPPSVDEAKQKVEELEKALVIAKQDLAAAEERQLQVRVYWIAGILALLALAAGVAAWFVPIFKGRFAAAAVGLAALSALCIWLGRNVWIIPWLGAAAFVAAILYGIFELRRGHQATRLASEFGDAAEDMLASFGVKKDDQRLVTMKMEQAKKQAAAGMHKLIDRIRS